MLWHERRYYSIDSYLKTVYGEKIYKISLDGGMTCPNRDGTLGTHGCIFCSAGGSGDFAASRHLNIREQIESGKAQTAGKRSRQYDGNGHRRPDRYIAYFQAYTNTYESPEYLRRIYTEAAMHPDIVLLSIATRPDCLDDAVLKVLTDISQLKPVWIELGLQTIHEETASFIRRGYPLSCFETAVQRLHSCGFPVIVHTIAGLPKETCTQIRETIRYACSQPIFGLKIQMLHILEGTDLADYYVNHPFPIFTMEEYVSLVVSLLEEIPPHITIHRLTGDGPRSLLIEPQWSLHKKQVLNAIHKALKEQDTWQGKYHTNPCKT